MTPFWHFIGWTVVGIVGGLAIFAAIVCKDALNVDLKDDK